MIEILLGTVIRFRMPRNLNALVLCSLLSLCGVGRSTAQSATTAQDDTLKAVLLRRGDEFMAAWKKHDRAGIAATLAPEFVAVGGEALASNVDDTLKGLMGCDLTSYHITEARLKRVSPTTAVLLTTQQQQVSCSGRPAPAVMYMTDTYVARDGKWLILIHTEAPTRGN